MKPYIREAIAEVPDSRKLKVLDVLCCVGVQRAHAAVRARVNLHAQVLRCAESRAPGYPRTSLGYVALVRSGMDCDGTQYGNDVVYVPATVKDVLERIDSDLAYADGPMHHTIAHPSIARDLHSYSRDLALEAFENGHPWSL